MYFLKLTRLRQIFSGVGIILILLSTGQLRQAHHGLVFQKGMSAGLPYQIIYPENMGEEKRPLILVAHGLAGSGTIMQGLALTFAHAGYVVATWDFDGHAGNPHPMQEDIYSPWLWANVEKVWDAVKDNKSVDTSRIAIVGHSMGTGAALTFSQKHPETMATVAISPVRTSVTPDLPHNLLLMAGQLEPDFVKNAQERLKEAGGPGGNIPQGTARDLQIIPGVEHISIIFAPATHARALDWLNETFGVQGGAQSYKDLRLLYYALLVTGTLTLAVGLIPRLPAQANQRQVNLQRRIMIMVFSSLGATIILWLLGLLGLSLNTLLGIRAGGYLILWFLVAGLLGIFILKPEIVKPTRDEILLSLAIFAALWFGIGLAGGYVWLPWLLIFKRLVLWPFVILALLPWTWLVGSLNSNRGSAARLGWWFGQSLTVFAALVLAIKMTPSLGFLMLLLPVFPIVLLFHAIPNLVQRREWVFALSGSLFLGWMILAVFPLI